MREIKFRFWNTLTGEYEKYSDLFFIRGDGTICSDDAVERHIEAEQYTGLKDKNGKEIYEGDILKVRGRAYEVKFDNYGQFYMENKNYHWLENGYSFRSVDIWGADGILVEVIGNIHENPELLEQEDVESR